MSFDPGLALATVRLSRIAYSGIDQAEQELAALGLTGFQHFSGPSTQALIAEDLTTRYLAFRGTESTNHIDWLRDAEFRPTPGVYGTKVHSGFRRALDEVWFDLLPMIPTTDRALVITGHSLGGGLAVLTAARLEAAGHTVDAVYTYGAPRPGLRDFAGAYTATLGSRTFPRYQPHRSGHAGSIVGSELPPCRETDVLRRSGEPSYGCRGVAYRSRRRHCQVQALRTN